MKIYRFNPFKKLSKNFSKYKLKKLKLTILKNINIASKKTTTKKR